MIRKGYSVLYKMISLEIHVLDRGVIQYTLKSNKKGQAAEQRSLTRDTAMNQENKLP